MKKKIYLVYISLSGNTESFVKRLKVIFPISDRLGD